MKGLQEPAKQRQVLVPQAECMGTPAAFSLREVLCCVQSWRKMISQGMASDLGTVLAVQH